MDTNAILSALLGAGGYGLGRLLSDDPFGKAEGTLRSGLDMYNPYIETGEDALGDEDNLAKLQALNPVGYHNAIMSSYTESPQAQQQLQNIRRALGYSDGTSGTLGTPQAQEAMANKLQQIIGSDQGRYFNQVTQPQQNAMSILNQIAQMGETGISGKVGQLSDLASTEAASGANKSSGVMGILGMIGSTLGSFL